MAAAVAWSSVVALSLGPMLAARVLHPQTPTDARAAHKDRDPSPAAPARVYLMLLRWLLRRRWLVGLALLGTLAAAVWLLRALPQEYTPREDRGAFFLMVNGPEGATFTYMAAYMEEIERRLLPYTASGEVLRLLVRTPRGLGAGEQFNTGIAVVVMNAFGQRRSTWVVMDEIRARLADLPGVRIVPVMRQGFGARTQKPVQFVLGGGTYAELAAWRDRLLAAIEARNPGLVGIDWDYKETTPQLRVAIDYDRAAELGVSLSVIGRTLETLLGSRKVTTYLDAGEEYEVVLEGERDAQRTPTSLEQIYVRATAPGPATATLPLTGALPSSALVPLAQLVTIKEQADANSLNRFNRLRAITLEANLAEGLALGAALDYLDRLVAAELPSTARVDYKGQSRDFRAAGSDLLLAFALGAIVVYLVLAAQFESWINPLVIMLTVPLAMTGALFGLWLTGQSLNLYSQIGLIMLVGLAAKNGILIVEFANQLRDRGLKPRVALETAAQVRLRPILMTGLTTAAGAVPLLLGGGAGAETRAVLGVVILWGTLAAMLFTLFVVPVAYDLLARRAGTPGATAARLERELAAHASGPERRPGGDQDDHDG